MGAACLRNAELTRNPLTTTAMASSENATLSFERLEKRIDLASLSKRVIEHHKVLSYKENA